MLRKTYSGQGDPLLLVRTNTSLWFCGVVASALVNTAVMKPFAAPRFKTSKQSKELKPQQRERDNPPTGFSQSALTATVGQV